MLQVTTRIIMLTGFRLKKMLTGHLLLGLKNLSLVTPSKLPCQRGRSSSESVGLRPSNGLEVRCKFETWTMLDQIMKSYVISSLMWLLLFYSQEQRQIKGRRIVVFSWACLETLLCAKKKSRCKLQA